MRLKIIYLVLAWSSLASCNKKYQCDDLTQTLFLKPLDKSSAVFTLGEIWSESDSINNVICDNGMWSLYLRVDSLYFHFEPRDLVNTCQDFVACNMPIRRRNVVEVLINSRDDVLFEGERVLLKDLDSLFKVVYLNKTESKLYVDQPRNSAVSVKWDLLASPIVVSLALKELSTGYADVIAEKFPHTEGASLCDSIWLNQDRINKEFPFNLQLHFGREFTLGGRVPPPPPPSGQ